jgi:hypothetical protein
MLLKRHTVVVILQSEKVFFAKTETKSYVMCVTSCIYTHNREDALYRIVDYPSTLPQTNYSLVKNLWTASSSS